MLIREESPNLEILTNAPLKSEIINGKIRLHIPSQEVTNDLYSRDVRLLELEEIETEVEMNVLCGWTIKHNKDRSGWG